ncbi:hypothetical protein [Paraburkholderia sp. C35]|uniref:hypothetical protein n=1 Tax=Paraburkholderia sp. C35 TaxID=2126993 RepID=UPI000D69DB98|nr:hypothetical protein [Paraburkholderia sp. C35]
MPVVTTDGIEVSVEQRDAWQCPSHGAGTPLRLFGTTLHCVLCGEQCEVRPSVIAAKRHNMRAHIVPKNGCHNRLEGRPFYLAQDGYSTFLQPDGSYIRSPNWVKVQDNVMSKDCRHSLLSDDPGCAGCHHNQWGKTPTGDTK